MVKDIGYQPSLELDTCIIEKNQKDRKKWYRITFYSLLTKLVPLRGISVTNTMGNTILSLQIG